MQPTQQSNRICIEKCHIYKFSFASIDETRHIVLETIPFFDILTSTSNKIRLFVDLLDRHRKLYDYPHELATLYTTVEYVEQRLSYLTAEVVRDGKS